MKTCKICGDELSPGKRAYCQPECAISGYRLVQTQYADTKKILQFCKEEGVDKKVEGEILLNGGPWCSV